MITSSGNRQMKQIVQLQTKAKTRYEQRVFVVEGPKMCFEAPKEWVERMYVSESFQKEAGFRARLQGYEYETVSDQVFKAVSDTKTPQGILCLIRMPEYGLDELLVERGGWDHSKGEPGRRAPFLLLLEGIQDPGNLGTMIRTGEGAGITGIIVSRTTVDIFHPKVVRATMGSLYRVPFLIADDLKETAQELKRRGVELYAAHLKGNLAYDRPDYRGPAGFLIGNEGRGLSEEIAGLADTYIRIPMEGRVESLNAAVAAALLMYEGNRQRRRIRSAEDERGI